MAFMTVLESDLRALSVEARRRYPAVKDAAEHAILKVYLDLLCQIHDFPSDLVVSISSVDLIEIVPSIFAQGEKNAADQENKKRHI